MFSKAHLVSYQGSCQIAERFYMQAVDQVGNVAVSEWQRAEPAMSVQLANFSATPSATGDSILLNWETVTELDNLGFNLYRAEVTGTGEEPVTWNEQLNSDILSQAPGSGQGATYQWLESDIEADTTYYYWLEDLALSGETTLYGPVSATLNVPSAITVQTFQHTSPARLWLLALLQSGIKTGQFRILI